MNWTRTLPDDWYPGAIPDNISIDPEASVTSSYSFIRYRSEEEVGLRVGRGALLDGSTLDIGPRGKVVIGEYAMVTSAFLMCDTEIEIGPYAMVSWDVVLMDTYRLPASSAACQDHARPVRLGPGSWVGFEACVLPGVTIGEGSIVGARSVVTGDVPPFVVVAGNPAQVVKQLQVENVIG